MSCMGRFDSLRQARDYINRMRTRCKIEGYFEIRQMP